MVDASGFRRAVLSANNVSGQKKRFGVGLEYEFADLSARHDHATLFVGTRFAPAGYGWIFPSNKSTVRVGIGIIRPDTDTSPKEHLKDFVNSQQLDRFSVRIGDLLEMHSGVIPANRIPMNFGLGRVIAVGDSVNQALPLLGEGIRYSIECGRKLGEIIKEGRQRGDRPSSMLLRYMKWWDARYRWTFWLAQRVNETISRYDDAHWDRGIRRLSRLSPHDVGLLMRMELDPWMCMRIAAANPDLPFRAIRKCAKMILHLP